MEIVSALAPDRSLSILNNILPDMISHIKLIASSSWSHIDKCLSVLTIDCE